MYKIEKTSCGYYLTFGDMIEAPEMQEWVRESSAVLATAPRDFGVFVDMRSLKPLLPEAQQVMQQGQKLHKAKGMSRSVVIFASALATMQFKRIAQQTGIYA